MLQALPLTEVSRWSGSGPIDGKGEKKATRDDALLDRRGSSPFHTLKSTTSLAATFAPMLAVASLAERLCKKAQDGRTDDGYKDRTSITLLDRTLSLPAASLWPWHLLGLLP